MDQISKSVLKNIESGQYFEDAKNWYAAKYLYPYTERSFVIGLASITIFAFLYLLWGGYNSFPLKQTVSFMASVPDKSKNYISIRQLNLGTKLPNVVVYEELISKFVEHYESYRYEDLSLQAERIKNNSTKQIMKQFNEYMSLKNPQSPILLLQAEGEKRVTIDSITLSGDMAEDLGEILTDRISGSAEVLFTVSFENKLTKKTIESKWIANINILGKDIRNVIDNAETELGFLVTDYSSRMR